MLAQVRRPKRVRAKHKEATTTKGWRKAAPKTRKEREALYKRCGAEAFLAPNAANPRMSKFPVMAKGGACVVDCRALRAALSRAARYKYQDAYHKAGRLAKRARCRWAV